MCVFFSFVFSFILIVIFLLFFHSVFIAVVVVDDDDVVAVCFFDHIFFKREPIHVLEEITVTNRTIDECHVVRS